MSRPTSSNFQPSSNDYDNVSLCKLNKDQVRSRKTKLFINPWSFFCGEDLSLRGYKCNSPSKAISKVGYFLRQDYTSQQPSSPYQANDIF